MGHHAHEEHQEDGQTVDEGAQEHTLLGGLPVPGGEGPLPHLRTGHGEHQIGDDVAGNTAVEVGLDQLRVQVGHKAREAAHSLEGSDGDSMCWQETHEKIAPKRKKKAEALHAPFIFSWYNAIDWRNVPCGFLWLRMKEISTTLL